VRFSFVCGNADFSFNNTLFQTNLGNLACGEMLKFVTSLRFRQIWHMRTKEQKNKDVEKGVEDLKGSKTVLLVDFTGTPVKKLDEFRKAVRESGGVFRVVKKRLLKFIFGGQDIGFEPKNFTGQAGVVFSPQEVYETSSAVYKSTSATDTFKILGGFDVAEKKFIESEEIIGLGRLPSKEILLAQLVGMISAPLKMLMYVINERAKGSNNVKS